MSSDMQQLSDAVPMEIGRDAMPLPTPSSSAPNFESMNLTQSSAADDGEKLEGVNLISALKQDWLNENAAPDLLYYESEKVAEVRSAVEIRQAALDALARGREDNKFLCSILQMELDRINFILHSYHRCRLQKIEKYAAYILSHKQEDRCSPAELKFLKSYVDLLANHFHSSFLHGLPEKLGEWVRPERPVDSEMIVKPDTKNSFVTFRVKTEIEGFGLKESAAISTNTYEERNDAVELICFGTHAHFLPCSSFLIRASTILFCVWCAVCSDDEVDLHVDDIMVGNWEEFRRLFQDGHIELI